MSDQPTQNKKEDQTSARPETVKSRLLGRSGLRVPQEGGGHKAAPQQATPIQMEILEAYMAGRPAAVLGGGPSLPADLARLPGDCTLIAVNHHALRLCEPDILVYLDWPESFPELQKAVEGFAGIRVSPHPSSDVVLPKGEWWDGGFSSTLAAWLACRCGASPVILCGMDCYQGDQKYFYNREDFYHPVFDYPVENHLRGWRPALTKCPNPGAIKVMSGPLIPLFGAYEPEAAVPAQPV